MTNFILHSPRVVFIHLPKTGGTSVRQALGGKVLQRFFGHIPSTYDDLESFAVVRDPKARFLSALRMFKFGNKLEADYYSQPRWPDLTISTALDVLEDPWIGHDRSQRSIEWNLKHHLLPQTHPFNCLHAAKTILRNETLEEDFHSFCQELGVSSVLPKLRSSRGQEEELSWSESDKVRFEELFSEDYAVLGYSHDTSKQPSRDWVLNLPIPDALEQTVFAQWPSYFSDQTVFAENAASALPDENCLLEPFADEVIPGSPDATWAGRSKDFLEHFRKLQPEFSGASRLAHLLACTIVVLRRQPDCERAVVLFWRILEEQFDVIRSELSLRWLVAIADTIADFGRSSGERAVGLSASIFANSTKLHESELKIFYPDRPWPPKKRMSAGGKLFDGLITFWTEKGDLIDNMFSRSKKVAETEPVAGAVLEEVIERLRTGPTVYRRFERISGKQTVPMLDPDVKRKIQRLMSRKL